MYKTLFLKNKTIICIFIFVNSKLYYLFYGLICIYVCMYVLYMHVCMYVLYMNKIPKRARFKNKLWNNTYIIK